ncbi:helicase SRCAP isoform X2 [Lepisosteus oculatus]|uniref:helicase SRCAP isoform X2 n=1 Tax=Lepisosteus oculatus TaxID=7918 RepID=UPI00372487B6
MDSQDTALAPQEAETLPEPGRDAAESRGHAVLQEAGRRSPPGGDAAGPGDGGADAAPGPFLRAAADEDGAGREDGGTQGCPGIPGSSLSPAEGQTHGGAGAAPTGEPPASESSWGADPGPPPTAAAPLGPGGDGLEQQAAPLSGCPAAAPAQEPPSPHGEEAPGGPGGAPGAEAAAGRADPQPAQPGAEAGGDQAGAQGAGSPADPGGAAGGGQRAGLAAPEAGAPAAPDHCQDALPEDGPAASQDLPIPPVESECDHGAASLPTNDLAALQGSPRGAGGGGDASPGAHQAEGSASQVPGKPLGPCASRAELAPGPVEEGSEPRDRARANDCAALTGASPSDGGSPVSVWGCRSETVLNNDPPVNQHDDTCCLPLNDLHSVPCSPLGAGHGDGCALQSSQQGEPDGKPALPAPRDPAEEGQARSGEEEPLPGLVAGGLLPSADSSEGASGPGAGDPLVACVGSPEQPAEHVGPGRSEVEMGAAVLDVVAGVVNARAPSPSPPLCSAPASAPHTEESAGDPAGQPGGTRPGGLPAPAALPAVATGQPAAAAAAHPQLRTGSGVFRLGPVFAPPAPVAAPAMDTGDKPRETPAGAADCPLQTDGPSPWPLSAAPAQLPDTPPFGDPPARAAEPRADSTASGPPGAAVEVPARAQASGLGTGEPSPAQSKLNKWITDRISPARPSSSSSSFSLSGWTPPVERHFTPLRGPHGKFISPPQRAPSTASSPGSPADSAQRHARGERSHSDIAELAKHEAEIEHRTAALKREGFWSLKRLSRVAEPSRPKVHWDYLCEEMQWLSADFAQERRWKRGVARKVVRMVMRHHEELRQKEERARREEQAKLRRIASSIAKEVRAFWSSVEKVVQFKQQSRLEEKRKKALDLQLDFIVGQTEKYSDLLSQSLSEAPAGSVLLPRHGAPVRPAPEEDDGDFEPQCEEEDDEETIEVEEQQEGNDAEAQRREIELLRQEGELPLDQLLQTLRAQTEAQDSSEGEGSHSTSRAPEEDEDDEFAANEDEAEDEEDTIAAQEVVEGDADHSQELSDLAREGEMSIEELMERYSGAYAEDFEVPSASESSSSSEEEQEEADEESVNTGEREEEDQSEAAEGDQSEEEESHCSDSSAALDSDDGRSSPGGDVGVAFLLKGDRSPPTPGEKVPIAPRPKKEISDIAATAESLQPKGYTLATTQVKTPIPFLLYGTLREYQHIGLDWLVTMYEKKLNGILADEMGLGKTIQTISLLAHLACEKGNWGPHLIIVPTSVMLNWEMELKRWCPGFKILTYYGSQKERKLKRQGWTKPNAFHVCITSYKLVLQDHQAFRRKSWRYLILDEAQNIKNFKSQRWQSLLNFNSQRRLLLTGTPLQNSLMELWSLMHFLMPHVFQSHREFREWFSNPLTGMIEGSQEYNEGLVKRLHKVLRPFLLRRIKADVEKQMPKKYEHVVRCRLSKRQRFLYDDFMAQASTRETLASGHFMSVINILMQLRKVCNHPNLFDPRPIHSPFITPRILYTTASLALRGLDTHPFQRCDLSMFDLIGLEGRVTRYQADVFLPRRKVSRLLVQEVMDSPDPPPRPKPVRMKVNRMFQPLPKADGRTVVLVNSPRPPGPAPSPAPSPSPLLRPPVAPESAPVAAAPLPQQQHPAPPVTVCSVPPAALARPPLVPAGPSAVCVGGTGVRPGTPLPVLAVRPPGSPGTLLRTPTAPAASAPPLSGYATPTGGTVTQRVLLTPDMQARLPSGEVLSIAQLASLASRPVQSSQGSKPVTFQLQGNKLTLSGAQLHQVNMSQPRPVQGNVVHLVSSGGQHHLISQPAQVAVIQTVSQSSAGVVSTHQPTLPPGPPGLSLPLNATQVPSSMVSGSGIVKIVVRQSAGKEGVPTLAVPPTPRAPPSCPTPSPSLAPHSNSSPSVRPVPPSQPVSRPPAPLPSQLAPPRPPPQPPSPTPTLPPLRPVLRVLQGPAAGTEQARLSATPGRDDSDVITLRVATPSGASPHLGGGLSTPRVRTQVPPPPRSPFYMSWLADRRKAQREARLSRILRVNEQHCSARPIYGQEVLRFLTVLDRPSAPSPDAPGHWLSSGYAHCLNAQSQAPDRYWERSEALSRVIQTPEQRIEQLSNVIDRFIFVIPPVEAPAVALHTSHPPPWLAHREAVFRERLRAELSPRTACLHRVHCNMRTQFPDLRLIQYDCGKLQTLHMLLRRLKAGGHRVLIFTQMTRMLDVLEQFLNYHGHIYLRLDGSTRVEQRQALMERFNADRRIFCFILSTRSGGVGVNLTGADTVVFYDSDWNPTMDAQAQDRCHRIGQTRDVHIYRLISERTVEENILKKANQKRMLGDMAIEGGNFTTAFFKQQTIRELFDLTEGERKEMEQPNQAPSRQEEEEALNNKHTSILEQALCRAEDEEDIAAASQAKAEQVAELAEFNENIPLEEGSEGAGREQEEEELSKAEQEIAALVEQLTPIERYAMNFLEASLEDVCKEELKQAEEQVEAARKGLDQAKEEAFKLPSDDEAPSAPRALPEDAPHRRARKTKEKSALCTRASGRLRPRTPAAEGADELPPAPARSPGEVTGDSPPQPRIDVLPTTLARPEPEAGARTEDNMPVQEASTACVSAPAPSPAPTLASASANPNPTPAPAQTLASASANPNPTPTPAPAPVQAPLVPAPEEDSTPQHRDVPEPAGLALQGDTKDELHLPSPPPLTRLATPEAHQLPEPAEPAPPSPQNNLLPDAGVGQPEGGGGGLPSPGPSSPPQPAACQAPRDPQPQVSPLSVPSAAPTSPCGETERTAPLSPPATPVPSSEPPPPSQRGGGPHSPPAPLHEEPEPHAAPQPRADRALEQPVSTREGGSAPGSPVKSERLDSCGTAAAMLPGSLVYSNADEAGQSSSPGHRAAELGTPPPQPPPASPLPSPGSSPPGSPPLPQAPARSPRKRVSADGEVLNSLQEGSPSAKVLRKLPGRLVTVVEEKELKRRRRGASGPRRDAAGEADRGADPAAEDGAMAAGEPPGPGDLLDHAPALPDSLPGPGRAYPADMPVLRNLPVRRRLETESRLAAQLGEQPGRGRGRGAGGTVGDRRSFSPGSPRKQDTPPERDCLSSPDSSAATPTPPGKRKRGRPPKTPPRAVGDPKTLESSSSSPPPPPPAQAAAAGDGSLSPSPKRKRGRPRKDQRPPEMAADCPASPSASRSPAAAPTSPLLRSSPPDPSCLPVPAETLPPSPHRQEAQLEGEDKEAALKQSPTESRVGEEGGNGKMAPPEESKSKGSENRRPGKRRDSESRDSEDRRPGKRRDSESGAEADEELPPHRKKRRVTRSSQEEHSPSPSLRRVTRAAVRGRSPRPEEQRRRSRARQGGKRGKRGRRAAQEEETEPPQHRRSSQSQESTRSSSASSSSSSSCSASTRSSSLSTGKKGGRGKAAVKRKGEEVETEEEEDAPQRRVTRSSRTDALAATATSQSSSPSSSDSEASGGAGERRLTRASQRRPEGRRREAERQGEGGDRRRAPKNLKRRERPREAGSSGRLTPNTTTTTGGESGSEVSVRATRRTLTPLPTRQDPESTSAPRAAAAAPPDSERKQKAGAKPRPSPVPEVLGKRCSALNAAAKLLAMRGRGSAGPAGRGGRQGGTTTSSSSSADRSCRPEPPAEHPEPGPRCTRQRPGPLVPPLEAGGKKPAQKRAEAGGRRARSRSRASRRSSSGSCRSCSSSSSGGSRISRSLSSQSTGRSRSSTGADKTSGSDREERRSRHRGRRRQAEDSSSDRERGGRRRPSRGGGRLRSRQPPSEGTPDRVLRSVAAAAAAQARTPASNTRSSSSSSSQHQPPPRRRGKT